MESIQSTVNSQSNNLTGRDIIVIGASAGGLEPLTQLVRSLPKNIPAAIFVVLHIAPNGTSVLPQILSRHSNLKALHPKDGENIIAGCVYVALPDVHLLVKRGHIRLARGPKENRHRPAIDPLFRTAANAYGNRVIGIVLSGNLDDGTAGLIAIKQQGGIAIAQDPNEALYDGMPKSAIENVKLDWILPVSEIKPLLLSLTGEQVQDNNGNGNRQLQIEADMAELDPEALQSGARPGKPSGYSCPECGGVLWELNDENLLRFRCRIGHAYSPDSLFSQQSEVLEEALSSAFRGLKERAALSRRMAQRAASQGNQLSAKRFTDQQEEAERHAEVLRQLLLKTVNSEQSTANS